MFQPEIAAMHPSLVIGHPQPAEMIAVNYRWLPTAVQLKAPTELQEATMTMIQQSIRNK